MINRPFASPEELSAATVGLLREAFEEQAAHPTVIMLSGGRTPFKYYHQLVECGARASKSTHVLFSDERMVPLASPDSNHGNTLPFLESLGIPSERILGLDTSLPIDEAAEDWHKRIDALMSRGACFRLGLLGLGTDGHTASIFTLEDAGRHERRWAFPVRRPTPPDRVSVSTELLERFEKLIILAEGTEKQAIIAQLLEEPASLPAGVATKNCRNVEIWHSF